MSKKKNNNYFCGTENEKKVARKLKRMGACDIQISPGSRGAADIHATFPTGRTLAVQVKSTCAEGGRAKRLTSAEEKRLLKHSKKVKATAVTAIVENGRTHLTYTNSKRKVR